VEGIGMLDYFSVFYKVSQQPLIPGFDSYIAMSYTGYHLLWYEREIPELNIDKWIILEIHETFYIDILFHLGSTLHNIRRRTGVNFET